MIGFIAHTPPFAHITLALPSPEGCMYVLTMFFDELSLGEMSSSSGHLYPEVSLKQSPCFQQALEQIHSPGFYAGEPSGDNVRKWNKGPSLCTFLPWLREDTGQPEEVYTPYL
jgi:hypothetical protein